MQLPTKIGIGGAVLSLVGVGFGWAFFPWFLGTQIAKTKGLVPGTESRLMWEKVPFALDFKVYLFNVTNFQAVQQGDVPMLDEIGPFFFDEYKEKADIVDHEENDTVSFRMKNTFVFNREKTSPLSANDIIVIPHPAMMGMINAVEREKPAALGMVNRAIPHLFAEPETIFLTTTVYDLLFGGNLINCTSKDFAVTAICSVLKKEGKDLQPVIGNGTLYKFSIFGAKNGTADANILEVYRGIKDATKVGQMVTVNGKKKLETWRGKPCNDLVGTDSTVFPAFQKPENDIWSFSIDVCRSMPAKFQRPSNYKGIETLRYGASLGDMSTDPDLKCFCYNDTNCLKRGVMDLQKCTGTAVIASLPHFLDCHEEYQKGVRGLHPEPEKHGILLDMEPMTGSPIYAKKRLQFAFPVHKANKVVLTENLRTTIIPFMWVEEGVELSDAFIHKIDSQLFQIIRAVDVIKWLLTALGGVVMGTGAGLYYKRQNNLSISPTGTANRKMDNASEFLGNKKPASADHDMGHTNYGYI